MKQRWLVMLVFFAVWALVSIQGKSYLVIDDSAETMDGYASQVIFVRALVDAGDNLLDVEPLIWVHMARTVIAVFFDVLESLGGPPLVSAIVLAGTIPLLVLFKGGRRDYLGLFLPLTVFALSYRAVLVMLSLGYLLLFLIKGRSRWYLVLSFLFANLSSGAVLTALLVGVLLGRAYRKGSLSLLVYLAFLLGSLGISMADKYVGFVAGDAGYDSGVDGATGILAVLSRNTIIVSLIHGDYVRGMVYIVLLLAAVYGFFYSLNRRIYGGYTLIFLVSGSAFMVEGLGVVSLVVPVLLYLSGVPLPRRPAWMPPLRPARAQKTRRRKMPPPVALEQAPPD
ncbi:MAG: hypothetical protein RLZZ618_3390 [Pseudomonadota bacterium]|jgi:hypothetical protein